MGNSNSQVVFGPQEATQAERYTLALQKFREKIEWSPFIPLAEILDIRDINIIIGDRFRDVTNHNDIKKCFIINDFYVDHKLHIVLSRLKNQPNTCFEFSYKIDKTDSYYDRNLYGEEKLNFWGTGDFVNYVTYFPDTQLLTDLLSRDLTISEQFIQTTNKIIECASEVMKTEMKHTQLHQIDYIPKFQYNIRKQIKRILANPKIKAYKQTSRTNFSNFLLVKETDILFLTDEQLKFFSQNDKKEIINEILADFKREFNIPQPAFQNDTSIFQNDTSIFQDETGDHLEEGQQRVSQQQSQEEGRQTELQRSDEIISQIIEGLEADSNR